MKLHGKNTSSPVCAVIVLMAAGLCLAWPAATRAATAEEVEAAIQKAKAFLYSKQQNGNWEIPQFSGPKPNAAVGGDTKGQPGGPTALVTYALLAAGESPEDPRIQQAVKFLLHCKTDGIYAIGFRSQVWLLLPQPYKPEIRDAIERDGAALLKGAHPDPTMKEVASAFYRYYVDSTAIDHSCSQIGVLGMWACVQAGYEVSNKYWQDVDTGWRAHQLPDGGWAYEGHPHPKAKAAAANAVEPVAKATMTAAGIATLFITDDYLHGNEGIDCPGNIVDKNIENGLTWMTKHFDELTTGERSYYGLYGVERIGVASGRKYFGTIDWYKEGADYMVQHQGPAGNFGPTFDTAFGLLFLVRGRAPVVMNKLQYDINMHGDTPRVANWNQRPRDAFNLVHWMTKQLEQPWLNWQVVNLKVPVEELHDSPILYITGNQGVDFTDEEVAKLRQFVEEGGLIFANADCGSTEFTHSIVKLCHTMFPAYEFRTLPKESPIYTSEQFHLNQWLSPMRVEALSNGARELVVICPIHDPSRYWQTQTYRGHEETYQFVDDLFLYCIDRGAKGGLRVKGDTYIVTADPKIQATRSINVARLQFAGNWNPEPGAWKRLAAVMHNSEKTDLDVQNVKLGDGKLNPSFSVASLTGTFKFSLTPSQRDEIKKYVEDGGTLIVDACGGDASFAQAAQNELTAIFPDSKLNSSPLPLSSPVYGQGPKLQQVEYRNFAKKILGILRTPRIRAMTVNGRPAVFFSAEDLTCGLLGMPVDGINGYEPASATALMEKLVLSAAPQAEPATRSATTRSAAK